MPRASRTGGAAGANADAIARYGFRLEEAAKAHRRRLRASGPDLRRAARAHHAAGRVDGRGGRGGRLRSRRLAGLLRHQQRRRQPQPPVPQPRRRHVHATWRAALGVADVNQRGTGVSMGAVWGDYDNDGFEDLFLYKYGPPGAVPQRRRAGVHSPCRRARRPAGAGSTPTAPSGSTTTATAGSTCSSPATGPRTSTLAPEDDADHAGELRVREERRPEVPVPQPRRRHVRGTSRGAGHRSRGAGRSPSAPPICRAPAIPDLFLANDYGVSELFANQGGKRFVDVGRETGVGRTPKSGMNASFGDVFNDGRLSIYKTNISEPGVLVQANNLWVPQAGGRRRGRVREPGLEPGRRPRRLELGRPVRRSEQRRHARPLSGQRLRLGGRADELLVRLLGDRRRPQRHHRRRARTGRR